MSTETSQSPLPEGLTVEHGDAPRLVIDTPACRGAVHLDGATVTSWVPAGQDEVLFVSSESKFGAGVAIRGGVPLCAPWFGTGRTKNKEPQHGFFRLVRWSLVSAHRDGDAVTVVLELPPLSTLDGVPGVDQVPSDLKAQYTVTFGSTLRMQLSITSPTESIELEDALHTYFRICDIHTVRLEGLDGSRYADKAPGGRAVNAQSGDVEFKRETDRVYASPETVTIVDGDRRIGVAKAGSASTVVWNPWERKAAAMTDFADGEWTGMVCVETANALAGHVKLEAGDTHTLSATISVEA